MRKELQDDLRATISGIVLERGSIVDNNESRYGWIDYPATEHMKGRYDYVSETFSVQPCTYVTDLSQMDYEEKYITQFAGTFTDSNTEMTVQAGLASCVCGKVSERLVRLETTVGEIIAEIMNKPIPDRYGK